MNTTHHDEERAPELGQLHLPDKPDGPGAAAILAAGIGVFVLGMATTLNEVSEGLHTFLDSFDAGLGVGPLSGKTIVATVAFFASWALLWGLWRNQDIDIKKTFWIGMGLGLAGAVLTFPPVFLAFA